MVTKKLTRNTFLNFEYAVGIGLGAGVGLRAVDILDILHKLTQNSCIEFKTYLLS